MISKLRRNFILITMCSTFAVLAVIIGTLNLVSYHNMVEKADDILVLLAENNAMFPEMPQGGFESVEPPEGDGERWNPKYKDGMKKDMMNGTMGSMINGAMQDMSPETPFETRFFSVKLDEAGKPVVVDTGKIAAVATEDAVAFAEAIWESGHKKGFYNTYRYMVTEQADGSMIVFIDRSRELASFFTLAATSISVAVLGLAAVFVLVLFFSKIVFRPVAASYEKQKRFITDASHELKTPLTIISANVEVLEMMQEENEWTRNIRNQVSRTNALVEQMVTLSRMDEENSLQSEKFSLSEAVTETAELFKTMTDNVEKQLEIAVGGEYTYCGDEKLIRQLVSLLVDNAVKYSSEKGTIKVALQQKGRHYYLTVWNTVEEIQKGNLDILFERFYRLDSSRNSKTGGSGIGLSIVKSIAEAHRGKVQAKSEDGKSLEITVIL